MNTEYFQQFLDQLNATGKMKTDGYDLSLFRKMNTLDLKKAEELLIKSLNYGDWNSINALCAIGSEESVSALEKVFPKIASNRFLKSNLANFLFAKTNAESYKEYVTPRIEEYDETDRVSTVRSIPDLPDAATYVDTLTDLAIEDNYNVVRFYSGIALLRIFNVIKNEEEIEDYRPILSQLAHEDKEKRLNGIRDIKKLL